MHRTDHSSFDVRGDSGFDCGGSTSMDCGGGWGGCTDDVGMKDHVDRSYFRSLSFINKCIFISE